MKGLSHTKEATRNALQISRGKGRARLDQQRQKEQVCWGGDYNRRLAVEGD
jgi:hypothetical protein